MIACKVSLEQRLEDVQALHEATKQEHMNKLQTLQDRELIVSETTSNLHERIVELQAENEDLAATLRETGELLSRTKEENTKLEEILSAKQMEWESEKKRFLVQVEGLVIEKSRVESELGETEEKVRKLEKDIIDQKTQTDVQIENLNGRLNQEKAEFEQLQNKLGDLVYEKSQLHMEIGHLEAQLKVIRCETEDTKSEADNAVMRYKDKICVLEKEKCEMNSRASELSEQNETLQRTLEKFQVDFDEYAKKSDNERQEAQDKIVDLTEEVEGLKEQKDQMSHDLEEWLLEKSELDMEVAKLQCRIKGKCLNNSTN